MDDKELIAQLREENEKLKAEADMWHEVAAGLIDHPTIMDLRRKLKDRARTIQSMEQTLKEKTHMIDKLHYVWCSGGCKGGVHRYCKEPLTEEIVKLAESNAIRLRAWYSGRQYRDKNGLENT